MKRKWLAGGESKLSPGDEELHLLAVVGTPIAFTIGSAGRCQENISVYVGVDQLIAAASGDADDGLTGLHQAVVVDIRVVDERLRVV